MNKMLAALCMCLFLVAGGLCQKPDKQYRLISRAVYTDSMLQHAARVKQVNTAFFDSLFFAGGHNLPYRLLPPALNNQHQKYPLVIVFHGSGAVGTDNKAQLGVLAKLWATEAIRKKYPAYVMVPQFPSRSSNYTTDAGRSVLTSVPQACLQDALALADSLKSALNIDARSIYVIGFSMGGSTAMNALALRPDLFAAGISFSGIPDFTKEDQLMNTPLWLIHGNADDENPFASDALFYKEMKSKGAAKLRFWELDAVKHEVIPPHYVTNMIPQWLFSQKRR